MSGSARKRLGRNIVCNCAGMVVEASAGFLVAPFLIRYLGDTTYGLWIVIGSLTSYFGLLDLGLRGSVGRFIALYQARGDQEGVNRALNSALAVLAGTGTVATLGVLALWPVFFRLFEVPPELAGAVRLALLLVGVNLGLSFLTNAFDATLWGFQRFDLLNLVDVPATLARVGLTIALVLCGGGLASLAVVTLAVTVCAGLAKAGLSFRESRGLRIGPRWVTRAGVREIFGYSVWSFLGSITRLARAQLMPVLIGSLLGVGLVTPYAIAARLVAAAALVLQASTGVLTPLATTLHARDDRGRQRGLFVLGGRCCFALSLFLLTALLLLGAPFIELWVGRHLLAAVPLLTVLALGELLPNSQSVTNGMIFAAARHHTLAYLNVAETVAVAALAVAFLQPFGLVGACCAVAVPGALCRGAGQVVLGCRLVGLPVSRYLLQTFLPALACALLPAAALWLAVTWGAPGTWARLVGYGTAYTLLFAACSAFLLGPAVLRRAASRAVGRAPTVGGGAAQPAAVEKVAVPAEA
jgi:O-antigen/teichoic acid export membrane protein